MRYTNLMESSMRAQFSIGDTVKDKTNPESPSYEVVDTSDWEFAKLQDQAGEEIEIRYSDLEKLEALEEGARGDWAILPATMSLYNKRTVDLKTAASEWQDHPTTILICSKLENGRERYCFVSSWSDAFDHYKPQIGQSFHAVHDQTGQSKGMYKLLNVVVLQHGEILKQANNQGINAKASLSVFK